MIDSILSPKERTIILLFSGLDLAHPHKLFRTTGILHVLLLRDLQFLRTLQTRLALPTPHLVPAPRIRSAHLTNSTKRFSFNGLTHIDKERISPNDELKKKEKKPLKMDERTKNLVKKWRKDKTH